MNGMRLRVGFILAAGALAMGSGCADMGRDAGRTPLTLADQGQPRAVVVTADAPSRMAAAADLLAKPAPNPWSPWRFRKDPEDAGVKAEWFRPDADLKDWAPIQVPEFWDAAIGEYNGYGWYRTTFVMPKEWQLHWGQTYAMDNGR